MVKLVINNIEVEVEQGSTIIQACEKIGVEIPRFCYHEKLPIAGNCRMCLVDVEKSPKPVASCSMPVAEGMIVHTDTPNVKRVREGVMELLLANHPLDCPVCDQGGECDLQDEAMAYGKCKSRYLEPRRVVEEKNLGPLISTHMTRCIHCTRCIRFLDNIAGVSDMGAVYRGEHTEITNYIERALGSELSGNIIDLCPVGALTSKPNAYRFRNWELKKTPSIDLMDAVGSNIQIEHRNNEVIRILPRRNDEINEEWISDKARFSYDGLKYQRIDNFYLKSSNGKLEKAKSEDAFLEMRKLIRNTDPNELAVISGGLVDFETQYLIKRMIDSFSIKHYAGCGDIRIDAKNTNSYLFNTSIKNIENADLCLIIGANLRKSAPIISARVRKLSLKSKIKIDVIGDVKDQIFDTNYISNDLSVLDNILDESNDYSIKLKKAKKPIIIVGREILDSEDSLAIQYKLSEICKKYNIIREDWNGYNVVHNNAADVGAIVNGLADGDNISDIIKMAEEGKIKVIFNFGFDCHYISKLKDKVKMVYIGSHGDNGANIADIVIPTHAYTEKQAVYLNTEGRIQKVEKSVNSIANTMNDWEVVLAITHKLAKDINIQNYDELVDEISSKFKFYKNLGQIIDKTNFSIDFGIKNKVKSYKINNIHNLDYYRTNPIARASKTMLECTKAVSKCSADKCEEV